MQGEESGAAPPQALREDRRSLDWFHRPTRIPTPPILPNRGRLKHAHYKDKTVREIMRHWKRHGLKQYPNLAESNGKRQHDLLGSGRNG